MVTTILLPLENHLKLDTSVALGHLSLRPLIGRVRTFGQARGDLKKVLQKEEEVSTNERQGIGRHNG